MNEPNTSKDSEASRFRSIIAKMAATYHRHRRLSLALLVVLLLLGGAASGLFLRQSAQAETNANIVILSYDNQQRTIPTALPTVGALLNKLGISIHQGDVVEPALSTKINQDEFRINVYRAQPIEIVDGTNRTYTFSAAASPRVVAQQAGVKVYPEDYLSQGPVTDSVQDDAIGEEIVIDRATPVNLMLYGHAAVVRTHAKTVGSLVQQEGIKLAPGDTLAPAPSTPLSGGMEVAVNHKGIDYVTETQAIAMPVQYIPDDSLSIGTMAVRQQGSAGQEEITYKVITNDGHEVSRQPVQTVVTVQPVQQIVARGTAMVPIAGSHRDWMTEAGISESDQPYADYIISRESGWCPTKWQGQWGGCPAYHGVPSDTSGLGYGLGQATPASKMSTAGSDWQVNPVTQLKWASAYAQSRWGGWYNAYLFKKSSGWW